MKIKQLFSGDTDNTFIQFFRYVFVGGFAFVVDYGIMTALVELCRFDPVIAATISFVAGLLVNYVLSTLDIQKFKDKKPYCRVCGICRRGRCGTWHKRRNNMVFQGYPCFKAHIRHTSPAG